MYSCGWCSLLGECPEHWEFRILWFLSLLPLRFLLSKSIDIFTRPQTQLPLCSTYKRQFAVSPITEQDMKFATFLSSTCGTTCVKEIVQYLLIVMCYTLKFQFFFIMLGGVFFICLIISNNRLNLHHSAVTFVLGPRVFRLISVHFYPCGP